jgi:hypothetical protein
VSTAGLVSLEFGAAPSRFLATSHVPVIGTASSGHSAAENLGQVAS